MWYALGELMSIYMYVLTRIELDQMISGKEVPHDVAMEAML